MATPSARTEGDFDRLDPADVLMHRLMHWFDRDGLDRRVFVRWRQVAGPRELIEAPVARILRLRLRKREIIDALYCYGYEHSE